MRCCPGGVEGGSQRHLEYCCKPNSSLQIVFSLADLFRQKQIHLAACFDVVPDIFRFALTRANRCHCCRTRRSIPCCCCPNLTAGSLYQPTLTLLATTNPTHFQPHTFGHSLIFSLPLPAQCRSRPDAHNCNSPPHQLLFSNYGW